MMKLKEFKALELSVHQTSEVKGGGVATGAGCAEGQHTIYLGPANDYDYITKVEVTSWTGDTVHECGYVDYAGTQSEWVFLS